MDSKERNKIFWSLVAFVLIVSGWYFGKDTKLRYWLDSQLPSVKPAATVSQPQAPSVPEPERFNGPTLSHEMRGKRAAILAYVEEWFGSSWSKIDSELYATKDAGDRVKIDFEAGTKVTPGREKDVLRNLGVGRAMTLVQEVSIAASLDSQQVGWPTGPQYGGDLNRITVVHLLRGEWALRHYLHELSPQWIDWKARQYIGRCNQYYEIYSDKGPTDGRRVWYRCNDLEKEQGARGSN